MITSHRMPPRIVVRAHAQETVVAGLHSELDKLVSGGLVQKEFFAGGSSLGSMANVTRICLIVRTHKCTHKCVASCAMLAGAM